MASHRAAPERPSTSSSVLPSRTEVTMSSPSKLTSVSEKVMKRSANCCISVRPLRCSSVSDSQKDPIRSRISSLP